MGLAVSSFASEWNFYGSAYVSTFVIYSDFLNANDQAQSLQGNSRIDAKINDVVDGRFEYCTGIDVRILFGRWNFGAGACL